MNNHPEQPTTTRYQLYCCDISSAFTTEVLRLPSTVTISNADALYRRTWYRNRRCGDRYENNLIIATAQNAEVIRFLMEHNWCIVKESNDVAYLTYKDSKTDTFAKV